MPRRSSSTAQREGGASAPADRGTAKTAIAARASVLVGLPRRALVQGDEFDEEPNATVTELSGLAAARRRLARATARLERIEADEAEADITWRG